MDVVARPKEQRQPHQIYFDVWGILLAWEFLSKLYENSELVKRIWQFVVSIGAIAISHTFGFLFSFPGELHGVLDTTFVSGFLFSALLLWIGASVFVRVLFAGIRSLLSNFFFQFPVYSLGLSRKFWRTFWRASKNGKISLFLMIAFRNLEDPSDDLYWKKVEPARFLTTVATFLCFYVGVNATLISVFFFLIWCLLFNFNDLFLAAKGVIIYKKNLAELNFLKTLFSSGRFIGAVSGGLIVLAALVGVFRYNEKVTVAPICLSYGSESDLVFVLGKTSDGLLVRESLGIEFLFVPFDAISVLKNSTGSSS